MIRGEIWTVAGGVYASKPRPSVIIQDDLYDDTESVTIVPCTSDLIDSAVRVRIGDHPSNGIRRASDVQADKVTTVRRSKMGARIGRLSTDQLIEVERAVALFLGLAR